MTLEEYCDRHGQATLAKMLGCSRQNIGQMYTGMRRVSGEMAARLEQITRGEITRLECRPDIFGPLPYQHNQ